MPVRSRDKGGLKSKKSLVKWREKVKEIRSGLFSVRSRVKKWSACCTEGALCVTERLNYGQFLYIRKG